MIDLFASRKWVILKMFDDYIFSLDIFLPSYHWPGISIIAIERCGPYGWYELYVLTELGVNVTFVILVHTTIVQELTCVMPRTQNNITKTTNFYFIIEINQDLLSDSHSDIVLILKIDLICQTNLTNNNLGLFHQN